MYSRERKVYRNYTGYETKDLARQIIKEVYEAGGLPFPHFIDPQVEREMLLNCTKEQLELMAGKLMEKKCQKWIAISVSAEVPMFQKRQMFRQRNEPV